MTQIKYLLDEDNNWAMSICELKRALDEARPHCVPRALVLINPGNPTGEETSIYHMSEGEGNLEKNNQ